MTSNRLIDLLPAPDRERLFAKAKTVDLVRGSAIVEAGAVASHVHFPLSGSIRLMTTSRDDQQIEVGLVGREGMLGSHVALGVSRNSTDAVVQSDGSALRLEAEAFANLMAGSAQARKSVLRYAQVEKAQLELRIACQRFHDIGSRLARWLLMSHDRDPHHDLWLTHETMASVLGVQRAGVTVAAGQLQRAGYIRYARGKVSILDRTGLVTATCGCYQEDRRLYDQSE